ncbi:MAG: hypothetical protein ABJN26_02595 [Stappiaceae bacterium]
MQNNQAILVLTGSNGDRQEYWQELADMVGSVNCASSDCVTRELLLHEPIVIVDLTSDVEDGALEHVVRASPGYPDRTNIVICLANDRFSLSTSVLSDAVLPDAVLPDAVLPDAVLTAPCPVDVMAGTVNQLRRLFTQEQELWMRHEALETIGLGVSPSTVNAVDDHKSVLIVGPASLSDLFETASNEKITFVTVPTLSAAANYMNWHNFSLAVVQIHDQFGETDVQDIQSVLKNIPLIISMPDFDDLRQLEFYDQGALDVVAGSTGSADLHARVEVSLQYSERVDRSKAGLAKTKLDLSSLPNTDKKAFVDTYRAILMDQLPGSSSMQSVSFEAYPSSDAPMAQDLSDQAIEGIQSVLAIAMRDEDLSLFIGEDQVLTILAGTDKSGAAVALRRIAAILKTTDLPATQDGQKIRVSLGGNNR